MEMVVPLLIVGARFERVADQSVNICEEILWMCTGEVLKHFGKEIFRVLFLSKGNSMRSQMAEGLPIRLAWSNSFFRAPASPRAWSIP